MAGRVVREERSNNYMFTQSYDAHNLPHISSIYYGGSQKFSQTNLYLPTNVMNMTTFRQNGVQFASKTNNYDNLGRLTTETYGLDTPSFDGAVKHNYAYTDATAAGYTNNTTGLVSVLSYQLRKASAPTQIWYNPGYTYNYTYDNMGNITRIDYVTNSGTKTTQYQYDSFPVGK